MQFFLSLAFLSELTLDFSNMLHFSIKQNFQTIFVFAMAHERHPDEKHIERLSGKCTQTKRERSILTLMLDCISLVECQRMAMFMYLSSQTVFETKTFIFIAFIWKHVIRSRHKTNCITNDENVVSFAKHTMR